VGSAPELPATIFWMCGILRPVAGRWVRFLELLLKLRELIGFVWHFFFLPEAFFAVANCASPAQVQDSKPIRW
jgi:hypothetical protein